jgi:N-acetylglucosaminyl-diphospho-decaprenol L-rhamnosyltransferase
MLLEHHRSAYRYLADRHPELRWLPLRVALRLGLAARAAVELRLARQRPGRRVLPR